MILIIYSFFIAISLISGFLFAGCEMALISLNKNRVIKRSKSGDKKCMQLQKIIEDPVAMINTLLIGINFSVITCSILVHSILDTFLKDNAAIWTLFIMSFVYLIIGEIFPKTLFRYAPNKMALKMLPFLRIFFVLFRPAEKFLSYLVRKAITKRPKEYKQKLSKQEFLEILKLTADEGAINDVEKKLILQTFNLSKCTIKDIMIPIERVDRVSEDDDLRAAIKKSKESQHSRIAIHKKDDKSHIVGTLGIYDILYSSDEIKEIRQIMRPPVVIKEDLTCDRAFQILLSHKNPFLIAKSDNAKEKSTGIVTVTDIINHLFGEAIF